MIMDPDPSMGKNVDAWKAVHLRVGCIEVNVGSTDGDDLKEMLANCIDCVILLDDRVSNNSKVDSGLIGVE